MIFIFKMFLFILFLFGHAMWHRASQVALEVKNPPANAGDKRDVGSIPGLGRSPNEGNGNPLLYFCLENPRDRAVWWAAVQRVAKSSTRLKQLSTCSIRNLSASTRNRGVLTTGPPGKSPSLLLAI